MSLWLRRGFEGKDKGGTYDWAGVRHEEGFFKICPVALGASKLDESGCTCCVADPGSFSGRIKELQGIVRSWPLNLDDFILPRT